MNRLIVYCMLILSANSLGDISKSKLESVIYSELKSRTRLLEKATPDNTLNTTWLPYWFDIWIAPEVQFKVSGIFKLRIMPHLELAFSRTPSPLIQPK